MLKSSILKWYKILTRGILLVIFTQCSVFRYSGKTLWGTVRGYLLYLRKCLVLWGDVNLIPGDDPILCKNEGCGRIGCPEEALQLNEERMSLPRGVTGEHHITHQAWGEKQKWFSLPSPNWR